MITVKRRIEVKGGARAPKVPVMAPAPAAPAVPAVPRAVRLLALAIRFEGQIREGSVRDQSALARRLGITQPRMTQIMSLTLLAPEIQEQVLSMHGLANRACPVNERSLRRIAAEPCWERQMAMWRRLDGSLVGSTSGDGTQTEPDRTVS